jgi:Lrp/AsnC family leucine-responsive transcriptional regulator
MTEIVKLDKLDRDILFELNYDCRRSDSVIAKKVSKSKQVVRYRIRKLEKIGVISSYNALIDFRILGFNSIRIYFKLRNISPGKEKEMYEYMRNNDLFLWTVNLEGDVDIAFYVWIKDIEQFYSEWEDFFELYRKYILRQEVYLSINMIHYPLKIFKIPEIIDEWNIGKNKNKIDIDINDLNILRILSRSANKPTVEIAKDVGMSPKSVAYRIRQLEKKKVILAYNAIIDETKIGYNMFKVDFYLFTHSRINQMHEFAKRHRNIKNVMRTIGGPDFEIEVMVKNINELKKVIDEIRSKFSRDIDYWRYNRFVRTIKQVYLPIGIESVS